MTRQRHVGAVLLAALVCVFLIAAVSARAPQRPWAAQIAIRHLIHHTSGLRDYNTLLSIAGRHERGQILFLAPSSSFGGTSKEDTRARNKI